MSACVRSSQIARWRWGQTVFGLAHAATLARGSALKRSVPRGVNVTLMTQLEPVMSIAAVALWMSCAVSPVSSGLNPGSGPVPAFWSGVQFAKTSWTLTEGVGVAWVLAVGLDPHATAKVAAQR